MDNAKIKINMSDRRPVVINTEDWPIVSEGHATWHDGQIESQANRTFMARIVVRRHSDGRTIVYGRADYESNLQHERNAIFYAGYLLDASADKDPTTAIQSVASELALECIRSDIPSILGELIREAESDCLNGLEPENL